MVEKADKARKDAAGEQERHIPRRSGKPMAAGCSIRASAPPFRWVCPCQEPPVLLATYDPTGRLNIKVRDRYWHLFGFGHVQAICPRCGAEHVLDLRILRDAIHGGELDRDVSVG
jgi:hypothetical protein